MRASASQEYVDLLGEAFELLGFGKNARSLTGVQFRALQDLVERLRKRKRGASALPSPAPARVADRTHRAETPSTAPARVAGRHVPAAVSRAVWTRDDSQCAFVDERGRRCAERRGLELHHIEAFALGGSPTEQNLDVAMLEGWPRPCGSETTYCGSSEVAVVGLLATGVLLTPTGWILFGVSYASGTRFDPKPGSPAASFAVVPLRGGAAIGGTFLF